MEIKTTKSECLLNTFYIDGYLVEFIWAPGDVSLIGYTWFSFKVSKNLFFKDVSYDNLLLRHVTEYILVWKLSEWRTTCMHERLSAHRSTLWKESRKKQLTRAPSSSFRHSVIFTSKWAKRPLTKSISRTIELAVNSLTLVAFMPPSRETVPCSVLSLYSQVFFSFLFSLLSASGLIPFN